MLLAERQDCRVECRTRSRRLQAECWCARRREARPPSASHLARRVVPQRSANTGPALVRLLPRSLGRAADAAWLASRIAVLSLRPGGALLQQGPLALVTSLGVV